MRLNLVGSLVYRRPRFMELYWGPFEGRIRFLGKVLPSTPDIHVVLLGIGLLYSGRDCVAGRLIKSDCVTFSDVLVDCEDTGLPPLGWEQRKMCDFIRRGVNFTLASAWRPLVSDSSSRILCINPT